jgi:hypothetical protein
MFLTPTETDGFENVGALLSTFQTQLELNGFSGQADALRGIEVLGRDDCVTTLMLLRGLDPTTRDLDVFKRHIEHQVASVLNRAAA